MAQMVKESACDVGDPDSIPGWGRSPGEGNGNPLHYYCLENTMGKGCSPGVNSFNFYLLVHYSLSCSLTFICSFPVP